MLRYSEEIAIDAHGQGGNSPQRKLRKVERTKSTCQKEYHLHLLIQQQDTGKALWESATGNRQDGACSEQHAHLHNVMYMYMPGDRSTRFNTSTAIARSSSFSLAFSPGYGLGLRSFSEHAACL